MLFVQLYDNTYYEYKTKDGVGMCYTYYGTGFPAPEHLITVTKQYDSWHDLFLREGYNPLLLPHNFDFWKHDMWVAPYGDCYSGEGHIQAAYDIVDVVYGFEDNNSRNPEYFLEQKGWLKLSAFSHEMRIRDEEEWIVTSEQDYVLWNWCAIFNHTYPTGHITVMR